jgi:hypothetical protein
MKTVSGRWVPADNFAKFAFFHRVDKNTNNSKTLAAFGSKFKESIMTT